jgi:hypothetical protein
MGRTPLKGRVINTGAAPFQRQVEIMAPGDPACVPYPAAKQRSGTISVSARRSRSWAAEGSVAATVCRLHGPHGWGSSGSRRELRTGDAVEMITPAVFQELFEPGLQVVWLTPGTTRCDVSGLCRTHWPTSGRLARWIEGGGHRRIAEYCPVRFFGFTPNDLRTAPVHPQPCLL